MVKTSFISIKHKGYTYIAECDEDSFFKGLNVYVSVLLSDKGSYWSTSHCNLRDEKLMEKVIRKAYAKHLWKAKQYLEWFYVKVHLS